VVVSGCCMDTAHVGASPVNPVAMAVIVISPCDRS